jgi:hypothetical protein
VRAVVVAADGARTALELIDDGQHGDGAYGARAPLGAVPAAVVVTARAGHATRVTVATFAQAPAATQQVFLPLVWR